MSVSLSSAFRTSQERSRGGFWLMRCAEIHWLSSRMRSQFLMCRKTHKCLNHSKSKPAPLWFCHGHLRAARGGKKNRLKTVREVHAEHNKVNELVGSGKVHQASEWLLMRQISRVFLWLTMDMRVFTFSFKNKWLTSLALFREVDCAYL